mgnify:CR=1 FL=1
MKKFFEEFKEFISRGNVIDLAVGVIIGAAFTAIVNSLVNDIISPLIGLLTGGIDFSAASFSVGDATFAYGAFINAIINFVLVALVIFLFVKVINGMRKKMEKPKEGAPKHLCPYCMMEVDKAATRCPYCTSVISKQDDMEAVDVTGRRKLPDTQS